MNDTLKIRSHVGRDVIQSAQLFRTPEAAIWEYVVNSLQYVDPGTVSEVHVILDASARTVTIADNGAGMDCDGLVHFFTMHAENRERRKGVPGRGKFGTGKSAAFGIGAGLTVDTVRAKKRQVVFVNRDMIDAADGAEIPIEFKERDGAAPGVANGTTVTISDVTARLSREPVVSLVERHLSAFQTNSPVVTVNGRICEIKRPQASITRVFTPPASLADKVGNVSLTVSAAVAPLDPGHRGVQITVGPGNLVAIEAAGVDAKEYGNRLFGHVDCAALDDPQYDPVSAYGNNRDLQLNIAHPVALALTAFIGASLEQIRSSLVADAKKARADADAARLKRTTSAIEKLLNADLTEMRDRLEAPMCNIRQRTKLPALAAGDDPDEGNKTVDPDGEDRGNPSGTLGGHEIESDPNPNPAPRPPPGPTPNPTPWDEASPAGEDDPEGRENIAPAGGTGQRRPRGGLRVETDNLGPEYDRSHWDKESRVITINLDHAVVKAARSLDDDEVSFRRLCYEIAFTAYAIALADLQLERDTAMDASDAMFEVRAALTRVWRHAEVLYAV